MKARATNPRVLDERTHYVTHDPTHRAALKDEALYLRCLVDWRGDALELEMCARRYVAQDATLGQVWTPWNVYPSDFPGTATASSAALEALGPLVRDWLESDAYAASRRTACAYMLRAEIADTRYGSRGARELLEALRDELEPDDAGRLLEALDLSDKVRALLDSVPANERGTQ